MDKFQLDKNNAVLVIVDIQEKLAAVMKHKQQVTDNCLHLIEAAKLLNIPYIPFLSQSLLEPGGN
jgi:PII-like signaling protein